MEEIIDYDSDEKEQDGENEKNNPLFGTLIHSLKGKLDQNPGIVIEFNYVTYIFLFN